MVRSYLLTNEDTLETRRKSLEMFSKGLYQKLLENETYPYDWISRERGSFVDTHSDSYTQPKGTGKYYDIVGYTKGIGIRKGKQYRNVEFGSDEDVQQTYDSSLWSYHNMEVTNGKYDNYYDYALNAYNYQKIQNVYRSVLNRRDYYGLFDPNRVETYFTYDENDDGVGVFRDWNVYENIPTIGSINDTINPNSEINDTALGQIGNVINKYMMAGVFDYYRQGGGKTPGLTRGIDEKLGMRPENVDENGSSLGFIYDWHWENNASAVKEGKTTAEILGVNGSAVVSRDLVDILGNKKEDEKPENLWGSGGINNWKYFLNSIYYNKNSRLLGDFIKLNKGYTPKESERYATYEWHKPGVRLGGKNSGITITPTNDIAYSGETTNVLATQVVSDDREYGYSSIGSDLLSKTKQLFDKNIISSLIGRTSIYKDEDEINDVDETTDTVLYKYKANPRGRALNDGSFYRSWTKNRPYGPHDTRIRHGEMDKYQEALNRFRVTVDKNGKVSSSPAYLLDNTVLKKNGYVRIAPTAEEHFLGLDKKYKTMLSIENLAWKDCEKNSDNFIDGEIGPNGGRIMWFVPYGLSFNESIGVSWNSDRFIGRGEKIFTYSKTRRDANLTFKLLVDYPSTINNYSARNIPDPKGKQTDSLHYDILRYFAGCETKNNIDPPELPIQPKNSGDNIDPKESAGEGNKIIISVYYPNNYTGHYYQDAFEGPLTRTKNWKTDGQDSSDDNIEKMRSFEIYDNDFFEYLMGGYNADVTEYTNMAYGYLAATTTGPYNGVSHDNEEYGRSILVNGGNGTKCFYRVDYDYQNKNKDNPNFKFRTMYLRANSNYKDFAETGEYSSQTLNLNMYKGRYTLFDLKYAIEEVKNESGQTLNNVNEKVLDLNPVVYANKLSGFTDSSKLEIIKSLIRGNLKIKNVSYLGVATTQDKKNARSLADRRAKALKGLLMDLFRRSEDFDGKVDIKTETPAKKNSVNTLSAKELRRCDIEIEYDPAEIEGEDVLFEEETLTTTPQTNADDDKSEVRFYGGQEWMNFHELESTTLSLTNESVYDKQRHFGPAYHSTTPEGFNARLNFLHQCTRQGHTMTASDKVNTGSAGNLGFGRMPVCVLRLGDFIYGKIIINSLNINFNDGNGMLWDMNPEGIGVQPMCAEVRINITFIGGQSLNGPLPRIQNGVSFNYYANTGAYDPRAQQFTGDTVYNGGEIRKADDTEVYDEQDRNEETTRTTTNAPSRDPLESNDPETSSITELKEGEQGKYQPQDWDTSPVFPSFE